MASTTGDVLFEALRAHADANLRPALILRHEEWSYRRLLDTVEATARELSGSGTRVLATLLDNGADWIVADLAAMRAGLVHVPLPGFFTPEQIAHACTVAHVDSILLPEQFTPALERLGFTPQPDEWGAGGSRLCRRRIEPPQLPAQTGKISFTSGTTGTPKGVCLDDAGMLEVAASIVRATEGLGITRHLCALPFAVLLENVAGVLAPLLRGASCVVLPSREVGLLGSSNFDPALLQQITLRHAAHSLILLPQMLRAWTGWLQATARAAPRSLELLAVGGAAVGARTLAAARALGLPAYEGYGLTEGVSVQTLNLPGADCPGSAGRPLAHARVRIAADGEIEIGGTLCLGYLGEPADTRPWRPTGDIGHLDAAGYLHVSGRKKHVLITGFGRNVSPEWVETSLRSEPAIAQAVVFGDGAPALSAVVWASTPELTDDDLSHAIASANDHLPDYARIRHRTRAQLPFSPEHGMATGNGRPRRGAISDLHANAQYRVLTIPQAIA